jgi:hypothetical protein
MKTIGRKGNWNEMAGTAKHKQTTPTDKDLKKVKEKEVSEPLPQKPGKTKREVPKPITKK